MATTTPSQPGAMTGSRGTGPGRPVDRAGIIGIGHYVPDGVITNADLERMVDTSDAWILERTGISERRRVGPQETASVIGAAAARRALDAAGNPPIDLILVATSTPDTLLPSTACLVQRRLGLPGVPALDVSAACSGFVYGMATAEAMVRAGRAHTVLLVAAEALTTLVDYKDRTTCVLFGDGAGAVLVGPSEGGVQSVRWGADGRDADLIYYGPGVLEGQEDQALRMAGKGTFRTAVEKLCELAESTCADAGWLPGDLDWVVPHQANLRIVEASARRLGIGMDRVIWNGDRLGNTGGASIPLALAEGHGDGRLRRGDRVLCLAFGAGSTWGSVALEWEGPGS